MSPDLVHLVADGGVPIGFTLPISEYVRKQWEAGELVRVNGDGTPYAEAGDDPDALAGPDGPASDETGPGGDEPPGVPVRPRDSAHRRHWQAYAVDLGACTKDEADGMTKAALVELVTPPEEQPPDPEA